MTAVPALAARYVLAPIVDGAAAWDQGVDLVLAPIRLATPVPVTLPGSPRRVASR